MCSATACSTTGRRATFRRGNTSRSVRSSARISRTTISPWVVTAEALAPFRTAAFARPAGRSARRCRISTMPKIARNGGLDITLEAYLLTEAMRRDGMRRIRITADVVRD